MTTETYLNLLADKVPPAPVMGLACDIAEVATHLTDGRALKDHQRACIAWAVRGGRRALFQSFGLGKTIQQLEILRLMLAKDDFSDMALIVAPLGVRQEFKRDAALLGIDLKVITSTAEAMTSGIYLTHYEAVRLGKVDPKHFLAVSLDEAAVLRD